MSHLNLLLDKIYTQSPMQKKRLSMYLNTRNQSFFSDANKFLERYFKFLKSRGISIDFAVNAYLKMCNDIMKCQISFMRSGKYPVESSSQANQDIYSSESEMTSYMVGLSISQFLWATHYEMFTFFKNAIHRHSSDIKSYLEIGPGHGIFLDYVLDSNCKLKEVLVIDISETSLKLTKDIINFSRYNNNVNYILGDILNINLERKFDFITMGEVLEHVNKPKELLMGFKSMLASGGRGFISTCANCPAIDHVYKFDTVDQIREIITQSGLVIVSDLPLPVENMGIQEAESKKITINYCAIVS